MSLPLSLSSVSDPRLRIDLPSQAGGPDANALDRHLVEWATGERQQRVHRKIIAMAPDFSRNGRDSRRFELKTHIATVAMHLTSRWRQALFQQVDLLLDIGDDEWEGDHELPTLSSWKTFVRLVIHYRFRSPPALGIFEGNILATWTYDDIRVSIECLAQDEVHWVASRDIKGRDEREATAGETTLKRLLTFLSPFDASEWLVDVAN